MDEALKHSSACRELLDGDHLAAAIKYCAKQRIEPPEYPVSSASPNANRLMALAKSKLSDYGWWAKRLKIRAAREDAMNRMRQEQHPN